VSVCVYLKYLQDGNKIPSQLRLTNLEDLKIAIRDFMIFSLQRGRKCLERHGNESDYVRRIEDDTQICCNVTAEGRCGHPVQ
jgi:hypothetical protein